VADDTGSKTGRFNRRITDTSTEIEDLIHAENDLSKRGLLLILNKFSNNLDYIAERLEQLSIEQAETAKKYEAHAVAEMKVLYRFKGWKDLGFLVFGLVQVISFYLWNDVSASIKEVTQQERRIALLEQKLDMHSKSIGDKR
jgi:hypothetical protein